MHKVKMGSIILSIFLIFTMNLTYIDKHMADVQKKFIATTEINNQNTQISDIKSNKDKFDNILVQEEQKRIEEENRQREEEQKRQQEEQERLSQTQKSSRRTVVLSRGGNINMQRVYLTLSHYGDTAGENGGYAHKTASGGNLFDGVIASNNFSFNTKIYIEHYGRTFTVKDTGNTSVLKRLPDGSIKIDVFVPREQGESYSHYKSRLLQLGIVKTYGYIIK